MQLRDRSAFFANLESYVRLNSSIEVLVTYFLNNHIQLNRIFNYFYVINVYNLFNFIINIKKNLQGTLFLHLGY